MSDTNNKEILEISIEDIIPNRFQPRLTFDVEALNELANSIREHGIIQPLVVRKLQDKFEIIAGERRYKAATLVGMQKVPCIVMNLNDNESAEVAVIENIQRKEMTPLEEAKSFKKILDRGYLTQDELARKMGKSQSAIANKLRLLNLDEVVQDAVLNNKISERHARSILKISSKEDQRKILSEILEKRLTVKQTDDLINEKYGENDMNNQINNMENSIFKPDNNQNNEQTLQTKFNENQESNSTMLNQNTLSQNLISENEFIDISENKNIPNSSSNLFKYNSEVSNNITKKEQEYQNVINPSVFSPVQQKNNNDQFTNINKEVDTFNFPTQNINSQINNMNIDVNALKMNTQDIKPQEELANIDNLLTSTEEKKENKFFVDLNVPIYNNQKIDNVLKSINEKINEFKNTGTKIVKEERDLGSSYEIIIRIDK